MKNTSNNFPSRGLITTLGGVHLRGTSQYLLRLAPWVFWWTTPVLCLEPHYLTRLTPGLFLVRSSKNNFLCKIRIVKTFEVNVLAHFWTIKVQSSNSKTHLKINPGPKSHHRPSFLICWTSNVATSSTLPVLLDRLELISWSFHFSISFGPENRKKNFLWWWRPENYYL